MKHIKEVVGACLVGVVVAACSGNAGGSGSGGDGSGDTAGASTADSASYLDGATFTAAMSADPGSLDPQQSASSAVLQLSNFAYDSLIASKKDGTLVSELAKDWKVDGTTVTMTMVDDVSCSDGTPFTAKDAAANINYMADPENKSAFLGVFVPAGAKASASGSTLTITLAAPAPFVLEGLTAAPMVCKNGLADRKILEKASAGTGPYVLSEVVASDHFTFTKREGYTWGPDGATTAEKGLPATVTFKIVPNETTAANLLLSGGLNAAGVDGPDSARLQGAGLFVSEVEALTGQMWFNHASGRATSDPAVRTAIAQATDFDEVRDVLTAKKGNPPTTFAVYPPVACPGDSVTGAIPTGGLDAAKQTLDSAGWEAGADGMRAKDGKALEITFLYQSESGPQGAAAAELAGTTWKQLGVKLKMKAQDNTALQESLFTDGNWNVAWLPLNVSSPDQVIPFLSGPTPPDGNNFAHIDNPGYTEAVGTAAKAPGKEGCTDWLEAETQVVENVDVIPFANLPSQTWGKQAEFSSGNSAIDPTSIRMLDS